ncbi:hypothetical protein WICMUC_003121 [Wickerhamomyces mucosus]|uniref:DNA repair protein rhp7 treble clef domain-containing protein n=1 Tax=Wickerhamomyces mucosus TaxID=1378264 RepID=A0A9P8TDP3_9ASCO|nr:hypothetical protein WICMUC_003121 [Wickerhamomyces mucosus]
MSRRPLQYRKDQGDSTNGSSTSSGIRGPNSALTEFLRQQGINAEEIRQRHLRRLAGEDEETEIVNVDHSEISSNNIHEDSTQPDQDAEFDAEELEIRIASRRKRRAAKDNADEYTDSESENDINSTDRIKKKKIVGDEVSCVQCSKTFVVSVYSRQDQLNDGYYCADCTRVQQENDRAIKRNQMISRKKRQKLAVALLDRQDVKISSLQDLSIKKITEKIEDVDEFGDIGTINMKKIAKILCRNRSLNDSTLNLFLNPLLEKLEFWDCSKLSKGSYDKICSYAPNIEKLTLLMCGKFHNDNLKYFSNNLNRLTHLEVDGPFLINNESWQTFFISKGKMLKSFKVSNTHRFSDETLEIMLKNVDPQIFECLKLSRLDGIKNKDSYDLLPMYLTNLKELEISYPNHEDSVDDTMLINLTSINGATLNTLVLDGCSALTDEFLINGLKPFCSNLRKLSLQFLDQITDEGFTGLFHGWNINLGLNEVFLKKCFSLGDSGIIEMLLHSNSTLVELSLNSIKDLTSLAFQILSCNNLIYLDIGFIRSVDDEVLELIQKKCNQLKLIDCYGNNRCTSKAQIREGLKVIGRQSDTV